MASVVAERITKLLKDSELFREACYIDGRWVAPAGGSTIAVTGGVSANDSGGIGDATGNGFGGVGGGTGDAPGRGLANRHNSSSVIVPSWPSGVSVSSALVAGEGLSGHNSSAAGMPSSSFWLPGVFIWTSGSRQLGACALQNHTSRRSH